MARISALPLERGNRIGLLLAGLLALITGVLVLAALKNADSGGSSASVAVTAQAVAVVAREDIDARTTITAGMVELRSVPRDSVAAAALTDLELAVGEVARVPIFKGEQLVSGKVTGTQENELELGLSFIVPDGMRAMAVEADKVVAAGGLVRPGDRVDVIGVVDVKYRDPNDNTEVTQTISLVVAQNVQVLAVEQSLENRILEADATPTDGEASAAGDTGSLVDQPPAQPEATVVTLALTPIEMQQVLLMEERGAVRLAVRAPGDDTILDVGQLPSTLTINGSAPGDPVGH